MSYGQTRKSLIERLQNDPSDESWQDFVDTYSGYIYVLITAMNIRHHDAEDLKQQVMVRIWKGLPKFSYDRDRAKFRTWLRTIVRNTVLNYLDLQSTKMDKMKVEDRDGEVAYLNSITLPDLERIAEEEWEHFLVNAALDRLRERFQPQVIEAFERVASGGDGKSVAEAIGIPLNTVHVYKNRVQRALTKEIVILEHELG